MVELVDSVDLGAVTLGKVFTRSNYENVGAAIRRPRASNARPYEV